MCINFQNPKYKRVTRDQNHICKTLVTKDRNDEKWESPVNTKKDK